MQTISTFRHSTSRSGFLPWLDWRFSLLLPVGVLLGIVTMLVTLVQSEDPILTVSVRNSVTDGNVEGALVQVGESLYRADATGAVKLTRPESGTDIVVSKDGFRTVSG